MVNYTFSSIKMKQEEKYLKWRLSEKPTAENLQKLVEVGILTKEEAKEIVLEAIDKKEVNSEVSALKEEMILLRKLVLELSEKVDSQAALRIIKEYVPINIQPVPYKYPHYWGDPYTVWCNAQSEGGSYDANQIQQLNSR